MKLELSPLKEAINHLTPEEKKELWNDYAREEAKELFETFLEAGKSMDLTFED